MRKFTLIKLALVSLSVMMLMVGLSGCGSPNWEFQPALEIATDNIELFVDETADIEARIVTERIIGDDEKEWSEKELGEMAEQLEQADGVFQADYTIEYAIPEEYAEIIAWGEEGKSIKALSPGNAQIHVTPVKVERTEDDPEEPASVISITVKEILPESITLSDTELTLTEGDEKELTAEVAPENAGNKEVTYASSNAEVVTVDENGKIKAVAPGEAEITVTAKGDEKVTQTVKVTVEAVPEPDPEPVQTSGNASSGSNNGSSSSGGKSGSGSNSNSKSSGGSSKGSSGSSSKGSSGGSSDESSGSKEIKGTDHGVMGGSINGKYYDTKEKYEQALRDKEQWEKDNGVIME